MALSVDTSSFFWKYISEGQQGLIRQGLYLVEDCKRHEDHNVTDYSYLVFPFAKAYEGFLKQLFLDCGFISPHDYESTHFRIGKVMNPHLERRLRKFSVYDKIIRTSGSRLLADRMWDAWKIGRNLVFHYYPHNLRALTFLDAQYRIETILAVMQDAVRECKPVPNLTVGAL